MKQRLFRNRPGSGSCDLLWLPAGKVTKGIHPCKPALLNYPVKNAFNQLMLNFAFQGETAGVRRGSEVAVRRNTHLPGLHELFLWSCECSSVMYNLYIYVTECICALSLCQCTLHVTLSVSVAVFFFFCVWGGGIWCHSIVIHSLCVIFIFDVTPRRKRAVWGEVRGRTDCLSFVLSQKEWNSGTSGCGLFVVACFQPAPSITINLLHMNISFYTLLSLAGNWDHFNWLKPVLNWPNVSSRT